MADVEKTGEQAEAGYVLDSEGHLVPDYDQTIKVFDDGDIVTGVIVRIDRDEILVDIGYKSEGVIPIRELSIRKDIDPNEAVNVGDEVDALVLQKEDKDGRLILSKKRAEYEKAWIRIEDLSKSSTTLAGKVIEVVKGGLILDIGLRGFLPASLVDVRRVKDLHQFVGQELECKVIEMDRNRNNVVLSRRSVLDEARKQEREKVISELGKGQICTGKVSSIVDFGAFVDLGGIDGLIHISEMSWTHVDHPSEVLAIGDEIKIKVLDIDQDRGRISLGLKQCQDDPWKEKIKDLKVGEKIEGKITKIVPFGAFVAIADGVEGLVHISELTDGHVEIPEQAVKIDEIICTKIVDIDADRRRVSLSIRQAQETAEEDSAEETAKDDSADEMPAKQAGAEKETKTAVAAKDSDKKESAKVVGEKTVETTPTEEVATAVSDKPPKKVAADKPKKKEVPETILESGDTSSAADALAAASPLDDKTSQAIDEALKMEIPETASDLGDDLEANEAKPEGEPGSFEDVLDKMKQKRGSKE